MIYDYILDLEIKGIPKGVFEPFSYLKGRIKPGSIKVLGEKAYERKIFLEQDELVISSVEEQELGYENSVFKTIVIDRKKRLVFFDEYNSRCDQHSNYSVLSDDFIVTAKGGTSRFFNKGTTKAFYDAIYENFVDGKMSDLKDWNTSLIEKEFKEFGLGCFHSVSNDSTVIVDSEPCKKTEEYYERYGNFIGLVNSVTNNLEKFLVDHESISDTRASYSLGEQLKNYNCSFLEPDNPLYKKFDDATFLPCDILQCEYIKKKNSEGDVLRVDIRNGADKAVVVYHDKDQSFLIGLTKDNVVRVYDDATGIFLIEQSENSEKKICSKFSFYDKDAIACLYEPALYRMGGVAQIVDFLGWFNYENAKANAVIPNMISFEDKPLNDVIESLISDSNYYVECLKWFNDACALKSDNHGLK